MDSRRALADLWPLLGGDPAALDTVHLTGTEPALPSSFRVGVMAQSSIAASTLAAAGIWRARTGRRPGVHVDMRHAAVEFRSERHMQVDGFDAHGWDRIAGVYQTRDGRYVRLHTNLPHHRAGLLALLGCGYERAEVARALEGWDGEAFESAATEAGLVVALMRSPAEWAAHGQGQALANLPVIEIEKIGEAPPKRWAPAPDRPLSGVRVLDLTRIIAGPVCGRTLAWHGADVLLIAGPGLPSVPALVMDTGRGKLSAHVDLATDSGRQTLSGLAESADVFVQGYRPGAIANKGFSPEALARLSPGVVCVSLSAYGRTGPWAMKRGFDSLVQTTTGINHAEAEAAGTTGPRELPAQALDHGSGYLMAAGAMAALQRQRTEGGSWLVRVSLAQTGQWMWTLGRHPEAIRTPDLTSTDAAPFLERTASGYGPMTAVVHAGRIDGLAGGWQRPSVPLGTHAAAWPAA